MTVDLLISNLVVFAANYKKYKYSAIIKQFYNNLIYF